MPFSGSTLTLDNFTGNSIKVDVSSTTNENSARGIPFTIQLNGTNTLNQSANAYAIDVNYANLIISGPGTLNINSEYDGISAFGKSVARDQYKGGYITVQNGAVVNVKTKAAGVIGTSELYVDATSTLTVETTNEAGATSPASAVGYIPTVRVDGTLKAKTTEGGKKAIDASNYIAGGGVTFRYGDSEDALLTIGDSSRGEIMGGTIAMDPAYQKPYMEFVVGGTTPPPANPLDTASSWAKAGITEAIGKGFVPRDLQNNYTNVITRQEFCRMAISWLEYATGKNIDTLLPEKHLTVNAAWFSDTQDPNILAAYALGITSGESAPTETTPGRFNPNGQFSRQQAATMLRSTCRAYGADVSDCPDAGWTDIASVASWAVDSVNFCYTNDLMAGGSTTALVFNPAATFSREMSILTLNNIKPDTLPGVN